MSYYTGCTVSFEWRIGTKMRCKGASAHPPRIRRQTSMKFKLVCVGFGGRASHVPGAGAHKANEAGLQAWNQKALRLS